MRILIKFNPSVIRLTGDRESEAFTNYMFNRHGIKVFDKDFAINFCNKYHADAILAEYKGIKFFYLKFK